MTNLSSAAVAAIHQTLGWVAIAVCGGVGLWGLALARHPAVPRVFFWSVGTAISLMLLQVVLGVALLSQTPAGPGDQHTFYGLVIAVTFSFAYVYRAQFGKRPALAYGLLLLFVMGLGLRGISTFGVNF